MKKDVMCVVSVVLARQTKSSECRRDLAIKATPRLLYEGSCLATPPYCRSACRQVMDDSGLGPLLIVVRVRLVESVSPSVGMSDSAYSR